EGQPPIRVFRRWRGLSQAQLAARTGSSKACISQLETGRRRAGVGMLRKLAAVLEVPMDLLMEQTAPAADAAATGRDRRTGR
ncbi:MAG TPA: XRE family transcriptional regulator, partial [Thermopetrobacter sp.]|nr:XRE family transcriptional regulator [Thermopetrobacter sp.]